MSGYWILTKSGIIKMSIDPKSTHYDAGGIEAYDVIKAKLTKEQLEGYCLGNALKYTQRANFKGDLLRDIEKAITYLCWLKESLLDQEEPESVHESVHQTMAEAYLAIERERVNPKRGNGADWSDWND
jgi:hypothetical protein